MDEPFSDVSALARTLLAVAWKNDRQEQFTRNAALRFSLELLQVLVSACKENDIPKVLQLTGQSEMPGNFLVLAASLSNEIDLKLRAKSPAKDLSAPHAWASVSDYDHAVFLALGQVLADLVWPESGPRDLRAPGIDRVLSRLAQSSQREAQVGIVQHYLGNILHDYFDRAQIRIAVRDLPPEVEFEIRRDDCRGLAERAFKTAESEEHHPLSATSIQAALRLTIEKTLESQSS